MNPSNNMRWFLAIKDPDYLMTMVDQQSAYPLE